MIMDIEKVDGLTGDDLKQICDAYHEIKSNEEIQTLRAKVASVDVLVEALRWAEIALQDALGKFSKNNDVQHDAIQEIRTALATYDKISEVKHDTK